MLNEIFRNHKGYNTLRLDLITKSNKNISLYYHLHDNPVQHIWQELFLKNSEIGKQISTENSIELLIDELKKYCILENIIVSETITQKYLNDLHSQFVKKSNQSENWTKINECIHKIESKLSMFADYDFSFNFSSKNLDKVPLKEEYKLFLTSDSIWGRLNLGYATVGKDWQTISSNNDNDTDLQIQRYITTEAYASFSAEEPFDKMREQRFYQWAINKKLNIPLSNLNELSFGRYMLGTLIITEEFLNYNNNPSDWYVPNHRCKWSWNKDVLGGNIKVLKASFFESDLFYSVFKKHAGLECV
jgi:hypothetical protein